MISVETLKKAFAQLPKPQDSRHDDFKFAYCDRIDVSYPPTSNSNTVEIKTLTFKLVKNWARYDNCIPYSQYEWCLVN